MPPEKILPSMGIKKPNKHNGITTISPLPKESQKYLSEKWQQYLGIKKVSQKIQPCDNLGE